MKNVLAGLLLLFYACMAITSSWNKSPAIDEMSHLTAGVSYWRTGDFRLNAEQGKFPQAWAALPVALGPFQFPSLNQDAWNHSKEWELGHQFFYELGNDISSMLRLSRAMITLLGVLLGLLVYLWTIRLFGHTGGLLALLAYSCSPALLCHGSLSTSDMTITLTLTAAVAAGWKVLHHVNVRTILLSASATALVFLSKASAFVLLPIGLLLLLIRLVAGHPLSCSFQSTFLITNRRKQLLILACVALIHGAMVILAIWASAGFRYSPFRQSQAATAQYAESWQDLLAQTNATTTTISWVKKHQLLPDSYLWGIAEAYSNAHSRRAFLAGRYSTKGWWYFFPFSILVKTPLWLWAFLELSLIAGISRLPRIHQNNNLIHHSGHWPSFYDIAPLLVILLIYGTTLLTTKLNIGHRHALALYPSLCILAGGASAWFHQAGKKRQSILALLLCTPLITAFWTWPNYLAYFNITSGGSRNGYSLLVDSSCDWGQELPAIKQWLDHHAATNSTEAVYLAYFGIGAPPYYGITAQRIPCINTASPFQLTPYKAGTYCISATMLQTLYIRPKGKWCLCYENDYQAGRKILSLTNAEPDESTCQILHLMEELQFARLMAFLRHRKPEDQINASILVFRLSEKEIRDALEGPPAELFQSNGIPLL